MKDKNISIWPYEMNLKKATTKIKCSEILSITLVHKRHKNL